MAKWICPVCGFTYEEEKIPKDFVCPVCATKGNAFTKSK